MTDTIDVYGLYTVQAGEALSFEQMGFHLKVRAADPNPRLVIQGSVTVANDFDAAGAVGVFSDPATAGHEAVSIGAGGNLTVTTAGSVSEARAATINFDDAAFTNAGTVTVSSAQSSAYGLYSSGDHLTFDNTGVFTVTGAEAAQGVAMIGGEIHNLGQLTVTSTGSGAGGVAIGDNAELDNAGSIRVEGETDAVAVSAGIGATVTNSGKITARGGSAIGVGLGNQASALTNHGHITVAATAAEGSAIGVAYGASLTGQPGPLEIDNAGVIRATIAIAATDHGLADARDLDLTNSGKITGLINLSGGDDHVTNSGKMVGDLLLQYGDDVYDGRDGKIRGAVFGGGGNDSLTGGKGADVLYGDSTLDGGFNDSDTLDGGRGDDILHGGGKDDLLIGGLGQDTLDGGKGQDLFEFDSLADSGVGHEDLITLLESSDRIDLSRVDADATTAGDQAFHLVSQLRGHAGELALRYDAGTDTTSLSGDVDGDGVADFRVEIAGDQTGFTHFIL